MPAWLDTVKTVETGGGIQRMQKVPPPHPPLLLLLPQGYQRFPLSKPVVGQNIALHAAPAYRRDRKLPSFCLPGSFNFFFFSQKMSSVLTNREMYIKWRITFVVLMVGIHFISVALVSPLHH